MKKSLSIITVNFNNAEGLKRTLDSVVDNLSVISVHNDWRVEHIIVDACSEDGSIDFINSYKASECCDIKVVIEPDDGPFYGMNKGVDIATGDYCIFMNSGDSFYDEHVLEKFMGEERGKDIYTGVACEHLVGGIYQWNPSTDISLKYFYRGALSHQSSFIKTSLIKKMRYDTKYRIAADWKFFLVALLKEGASYETLPFFVSHYMDGGISRDAEKAFAERDLILKECFEEREVKEAIMAYEWEKLSRRVDTRSKVGKVVFWVVEFLQSLRR